MIPALFRPSRPSRPSRLAGGVGRRTPGRSPSAARRRRLTSLVVGGALAATGLTAFPGPAQAATEPQDATGPTAYVANFYSDTVSVVDTSTNTITDSITVGRRPVGVAVNPAHGHAYATNFNEATVSAINTDTNEVTATIPVGSNPLNVAFTPSGTRAYVANSGGTTVSVIDTATNKVSAAIPVGNSPNGVTITPSGATAYVTNSNEATVSVVDTETNTVTDTVPVGASPAGVAVSPSGAVAYVANSGGNTVSVIDTATNAVSDTIVVGTSPNSVVFDASGTRAYVADRGSDDVKVIETASGTVTATVPVGDSPARVEAAPSGTAVYATNLDSGTVSVIDTGTNEVTATIADFTGPYGLAFAATPSPARADIDVGLTAQPRLGLLVPYLSYDLTAHNTGPSAVTSATLTAKLPPGAEASHLASGCTADGTTVTCEYGTIADGASATRSFRVPLHLLTLGPVEVSASRTDSAPIDPNPANDTASVTCNALSVVLVTCP
ncbi:hypothetical protein ACX6XY_26305 [Streptomyces sp. O3]